MLLWLVQFAAAAPVSPTGGLVLGQNLPPDDHALTSAFEGMGRLGLQVAPPLDFELEIATGSGRVNPDRNYGFSRWSARVAAVGHLTPDARVDVFLSVGAGLQWVNVERDASAPAAHGNALSLYDNPSSDGVIHAGPGMTIWIAGPLHLRADARWLGSFGGDPTVDSTALVSNVEWTFGLDFRAERPPDGDADGVPDKRDLCPAEAEDRDGVDDEDGCPDLDEDGDGVADADDQCPDRAEDIDGFQDDDGCPERDNDDDGVVDKHDRCPDDAEDVDGFEDTDGCPEGDDDGDGVADRKDKCPEEPETRNGFRDKDGCPDEVPAEVARFTGVIDGITFETNKAVIRPASTPVLQEALAVLETYGDLRLEISGHTDDVGDDRLNLELSQARADAVRTWFVAHGVESDRLRAVGYGELRPRAENSTDAGRAENRRVEFRPLEE
ncbi:hypothetical protein LBMAG42_30740 [Deltaproteobacteria bacterium]|nr:hypothetical protein LBMAG42_30740 [Deltaproteobacteria bacterium]